MEIAAAPPAWYSAAIASTFGFSTIDPADGDADLISAMTLMRFWRRAAVNAKGGSHATVRAGGGSVPRRARVRATMSSRMVIGSNLHRRDDGRRDVAPAGRAPSRRRTRYSFVTATS